MSGCFGTRIQLAIFGESHGPAIGITVDGLPPGLKLDMDFIESEMARRAPGQSALSTSRKEPDAPEILSGLLDGVTTGAPLCAVIRNTNQRSRDYGGLGDLVRPGHSDYTGHVRYFGYNDVRGGGHFSGRITAPLVFAGAICKQLLMKRGVEVFSHAQRLAGIQDESFLNASLDLEALRALRNERLAVIQKPLAQEMAKLIPLAAALEAKIAQQEQQWLLTEVEQPLAEVLASMELIGFSLDTEGLTAYGQELDTQLTARAEEIYELAGGQFNINSPMQLGNVLFEKLGLPHGKKTQRGYSTNADVLESLRDKHPIIDCILDYRKLAKLKNTYVDGLIKVVGEDGRVHSIFKQTETRTGRISSAEPNLQNIPVRTDVGSVFRKFFYAAGDRTLVDADYSQIELRVLAHIAQDENMIEGFRSGADIHTQTAAQVFGMPPEYVTSQMRSRAKAVNFGIVYGIGAYSLSKDIGVTVAEANAYINGYLRTYHGVRQYMEDTKQCPKYPGYVKTLVVRRRDLPEMSATNRITKAFGERVAMNTPIQGTAADIIKIAMVRVYRRLQAEGLKSRLILQVHDELIVETTPDEIDTVKALVQQEMSGAAELSVPLVVDVGVGKTWYEAK